MTAVSIVLETFPLLTHSTTGRLMNASEAQERAEDIVALTSGLSAGNEEAFRKFHALYFDRLFRYQLVLARGDEELAHEALQETFLRVVRHARRFDDKDVFWSWLTVLCRSAAVDGGRKRQRYWNLLANYARSLIAPAVPATPGPDCGEQLYELLDECLAQLSAEERALLERKYFGGASMRDLADETGLTERAVESRLFRARNELRVQITARLNHEKAS